MNQRDTANQAPAQPQNQAQQQKECVTCVKTIRKGLAPILCSTCTNVSHASCTKLPRDQIIKLRTVANTWRCSICLNPTNQTNNTRSNTAELEKSKCYKCKGPICKGKGRMKCKKCKKECHKSCTGITKDATQVLHEKDEWLCDYCSYTPPPGSDTIKQQDIQDGAGPKQTGEWRNLRILQWNADGLNTKIAELNSVTKKLDIDVVLIQETKLTASSSTPNIQGRQNTELID